MVHRLTLALGYRAKKANYLFLKQSYHRNKAKTFSSSPFKWMSLSEHKNVKQFKPTLIYATHCTIKCMFMFLDTKDIKCYNGWESLLLSLSKTESSSVLRWTKVKVYASRVVVCTSVEVVSYEQHPLIVSCHFCEPDSFTNIPFKCFGIYFVSTRCKQQSAMLPTCDHEWNQELELGLWFWFLDVPCSR